MSIDFTNLRGFFAQYYDRMIVGIVVVAMVVSAVVTFVGVRAQRKDLADQRRFLASRPPSHPNVSAVDATAASRGLRRIDHPYTAMPGSNALVLPPLRVWCVSPSCHKPIEYEAMHCPFCGADQPEENPEPIADIDNDGMMDVWEDEHGLNKYNPDDAQEDLDNDGFTNLEEFKWDPSTDPGDPKVHPPLVVKLCLKSTRREPFPLRFKAHDMLGKKHRFHLNKRGARRTYFKFGGEEVADGWKIVGFAKKMAKRTNDTTHLVREVDVSELKLRRGNAVVVLVKGENAAGLEIRGTLVLTVDGREYPIQVGGPLELDDISYKVIDIRPNAAVLNDPTSGKPVTIGPCRR